MSSLSCLSARTRAAIQRCAHALVASALLALFTGFAMASPYHLMLQARQNIDGPNEVFVGSFANLDDVFAGNVGNPTGYTDIGVSANFRIVGLTYDGNYRLMVETRQDGTAPNEVFVASYATLNDVFAANPGSPTGFTQIAISPDYRIVGLAYDGSYRVMVETRLDGTAPYEVFLASFATLDDLFAGTTAAPTDFTEIAISPDFQIADFTYDGSYRVMVETRLDGTAPYEVFLASFATLDDLFSGTTAAPTNFTEIAIAPSFQIVGFTGEWLPAAPVPEPGTFLLFSLGLCGAGWMRRCNSGEGRARRARCSVQGNTAR